MNTETTSADNQHKPMSPMRILVLTVLLAMMPLMISGAEMIRRAYFDPSFAIVEKFKNPELDNFKIQDRTAAYLETFGEDSKVLLITEKAKLKGVPNTNDLMCIQQAGNVRAFRRTLRNKFYQYGVAEININLVEINLAQGDFKPIEHLCQELLN